MNIFKNLFMIGLTCGLLVFVTFIKSEVRALTKETQHVIKQQEKLEENIKVLEAEFAYLTNPARLAKISEKLNFKNIDFNSTKPQLVSLRYPN
ncbi:MAG TPA: hypothetical protein DCL21_04205 [Alphaproteobacteria bacterium]|nr:hypothetical protein [Alphaproteobacteria bacterium]